MCCVSRKGTSCAGGRHNMPPGPGPAPCQLTFDLLTLKVVSESRVTWATSVPILVFPGLSVLDLGPMYATDRQTSDAHHHLMPLTCGRGHNKLQNRPLFHVGIQIFQGSAFVSRRSVGSLHCGEGRFSSATAQPQVLRTYLCFLLVVLLGLVVSVPQILAKLRWRSCTNYKVCMVRIRMRKIWSLISRCFMRKTYFLSSNSNIVRRPGRRSLHVAVTTYEY